MRNCETYEDHLFLLSLVTAHLAFAKELNSETNEVIVCGANKAVVIPGTKSPEGRFAIGWTILPTDRRSPPVDWTKLPAANDGIYSFLDLYAFKDPDTADAPYELDNCVIDLSQRTLLILPGDWAYFPHKNRGYLKVMWPPVDQGHRYALVQNDARFFTCNLWLVDIVGKKMHQTDLVPTLSKKVERWLQKRRPDDHKRYGIFFPLEGDRSAEPNKEILVPSASFQTERAFIPFQAEIPKSLDEASSLSGGIVVDLPGGAFRKMLFFQ